LGLKGIFLDRTPTASKTALAIAARVGPWAASPLPFFVAANTGALTWAYYTSLGLALLTLFSLGLFLGRISHGRMIVYGLKTVLAGVVSIAISYFLGASG
jgi:predicted membrane protein (TIGR00267 family)